MFPSKHKFLAEYKTTWPCPPRASPKVINNHPIRAKVDPKVINNHPIPYSLSESWLATLIHYLNPLIHYLNHGWQPLFTI